MSTSTITAIDKLTIKTLFNHGTKDNDTLMVWVSGDKAPSELSLVLDLRWKSSEPLPSELAADKHGRPWSLTTDTVTDWVISAGRDQSDRTERKFEINFEVPIKRNAGESQLQASVDLDGALHPLAPTPLQPPPWRVALETIPTDIRLLQFGDRVTLRCVLFGATDAELGPFPPEEGMRSVRHGDTATVHVLENGVYTLTAKVELDGKSVPVEQVVRLVARPPGGFLHHFNVVHQVLPGGPVACSFDAINVETLDFVVERNGLVEEAPGLSKRGRPAASDPAGGPVDLKDRTLVVTHGPDAGEKLKVRARWSVAGRNHQHTLARVSAVATDTRPPLAPGETVLTFASGGYDGTIRDGKPVSVGGIVPVEWIAVATRGHGLFVRTMWTKAELPRHGEQKWFADQDCLAVTGIGAPDRMHRLVCVVREDRKLALKSIELPAGAVSDLGLALGPEFTPTMAIRLHAIGKRVVILGSGVAVSFVLDGSNSLRPEPELARVASDAWSVVAGAAVPPRPATAPDPAPRPGGHLYALERRNLDFLRFDLADLDATFSAPRVLAAPNDKLAHLDLLQRSQRDDVGYLAGDGRYNLASEPGGTKPVKLHDRRVWRRDRARLELHATLVLAGGLIAARTLGADSKHPERGVQDRVYDPRFDVWTACGRLFPELDASESFALTCSRPLAPASVKAPSTLGAFFARRQDGTILRVHGDVRTLLGCVGIAATPIELPPQSPPFGLRGATLRAGEDLAHDQYLQSLDGNVRLRFQWTENHACDLVLVQAQDTSDGARAWAVQWRAKQTASQPRLELDPTNGSLRIRDPFHAKVVWRADSERGLRDPKAHHYEQQGLTPPDRLADDLATATLRITSDGLETRTDRGLLLWRTPRAFRDALPHGEVLLPGDTLCVGTPTSPTGVLAAGSAVVEFHEGQLRVRRAGDLIVWSTGTRFTDGLARVDDGHLVVFDRASDDTAPKWSSRRRGSSGGQPSAWLRLSPALDLEVCAVGGAVLWSSRHFRGEVLAPNSTLAPGDYLEDPSRTCMLTFGTNGVLDLRIHGSSMWTAKASGAATACKLEHDGDLVLGEWRASGHGAGTLGRVHADHCGGLRVVADGWEVISADARSPLRWYGVSLAGKRDHNTVVGPARKRVRLYNSGTGGFLFAADSQFLNTRRLVLVAISDEPHKYNDSVWEVIDIEADVRAFYNTQHQEYLCASGYLDDDRWRQIVVTDKFSVGGEVECALFRYTPGATTTTLTDTGRRCVLYTAPDSFVRDNWRRVFANKTDNSRGDRELWTLKGVTE